MHESLESFSQTQVTLLLLLIMHRDLHWMIENPVSSIVWLHDRLRKFLASRQHFATCTWLGEYGGRTPKCVRLYASSPWVYKLHRKLNRPKWKDFKSDTVVKYIDSKGKVRYHGSKTLRATQVYPPSFCRNASCLILYRGLGFREYVYNKPVIIQYAYIYIISLLSCNMHIYIYICAYFYI